MTIPCPGCGRLVPAVPGYVLCLTCGKWWVILA